MELRQLAVAYLFHNDNVLMMKKVNRELSENPFWTGLGGHFEPHEWNSPKSACLREILEESGIREHEVEGLKLRYILLRIKEDEIRQQFVYFGKTQQTNLIESNEGSLHWIQYQHLMNLPMSRVIHLMLKHYNHNRKLNDVMIGTMRKDAAGEPVIQWADLIDPDVF